MGSPNPPGSGHFTVGLAWTAYIRTAIIALILLVPAWLLLGSAFSVSPTTPASVTTPKAADHLAHHRKASKSSVTPEATPRPASVPEPQRPYSKWSFKIGMGLLLFVALTTVYRVLLIRSIRLYTDDSGVWCYSGVLPWSRGVQGVRWRDLEDAVYFTGFFSWIFRSYRVRMGHRFTRTSEMILNHVPNGPAFVERINSIHGELLARMPSAASADSPS